MNRWFNNKSILTPTSGFLASGFTHTLNPYIGCSFAGALCGEFCYAQHNYWITKGRPWQLYAAKKNLIDAYRRDYDRIKRPGTGHSAPLRIYMSSVTDPYIPQEASLGQTRTLLREMVERPPDVLVIQTHNTLISRDSDLIGRLARKSELWVSMTVETDWDPLPGFRPHASSPAARMQTAVVFRNEGILTQITVSPLLPIANLQRFATSLDLSCDRVIVDHFLIGDGSANGLRTHKTGFVQRLQDNSFTEWTYLEKLWEVRDYLEQRLGADRVLVSCDGFNAVGRHAAAPRMQNQSRRESPYVKASPRVGKQR